VAFFRPRYADGQILELGAVRVRLRVSARARRISLRVDRLRREAIAVAPSARHLADAADFARARQDWLAERLAEVHAAPDAPFLAAGDVLGVLGETWRLQPDGRRPRLAAHPDGGLELAGCGAGEVDAQLVTRAIRREAANVFAERIDLHCAILGAPAPPLSLNDARTRWGSCTPAQRGRPAGIRLNWRLALAPWPVADYVVAHECAHLLEANHGPRFWAWVTDLVGDPRPHRAWLRRHGGELHAVLPRA
jgi:predicted metal-dependent hydrolase